MSLDKRFRATLEKSPRGGWTYLVWPDSVEFFGTRGLVKVRGTIDEHPSAAPSWRWATGRTPLKSDLRRAIGKEAGDSVTVRLEERIEA